MGRGCKAVDNGTEYVSSSKSGAIKSFLGCWAVFRFLGGCMSMRSKVDNSASGYISRYESKRTNDSNIEEPVHPFISSLTTSDAESIPSTANSSQELRIAPRLQKFTYNELKLATRNFRPDCLIGRGGFGYVYKGRVSVNGTELTVAVKSLNDDGLQGHKEWLAEVNYLDELVHPHLVKLIGYCIEDDQRLLIYEYMPRGSLENHLFKRTLPLPWNIRMKIALGAAKGLAFLHEESSRSVIYRDFKTSNILLDTNYNAKLSDFGLAKDGPQGDATHVSTRVVGTYGYAAPEYVMTGHLTTKSDVYSFGVVLLELLTGRRSMDKRRRHGERNLVRWVRPFLQQRRKLYRLVDPRLEGHFSIKGVQQVVQLAACCLNCDAKARPAMSEVVKALEPLPELTDMAHSSSSFQAIEAARAGGNANARNGTRAQPGMHNRHHDWRPSMGRHDAAPH